MRNSARYRYASASHLWCLWPEFEPYWGGIVDVSHNGCVGNHKGFADGRAVHPQLNIGGIFGGIIWHINGIFLVRIVLDRIISGFDRIIWGKQNRGGRHCLGKALLDGWYALLRRWWRRWDEGQRGLRCYSHCVLGAFFWVNVSFNVVVRGRAAKGVGQQQVTSCYFS